MAEKHDADRGATTTSDERGRLCGATRGGNVAPLTTPDRQTGRAALVRPVELPAGSRGEEWCSPLQGGGGGHASEAAQDGDSGDEASLFSSYLGHNCPTQGLIAERQRWLEKVEHHTAEFRIAMAGRSRYRATAARKDGEHSRADWHDARATGHRTRFERVAQCGGQEMVMRCNECGHEQRRLCTRCRHWRLCVGCRGKRAREYRLRFRASRREAVRQNAWLMRDGAPGGRWGERFITLTLTHSGDVKRDLQVLPDAWRRFRKQLTSHLIRDRGVPMKDAARVVWLRVIEVTPGSAGDGHAHLHVYMLSPFVHVAILSAMWGKAMQACGHPVFTRSLSSVLEEQCDDRRRAELARFLVTRRGPKGRPLDPVPSPNVWVERCDDRVEYELAKYLVKDAERTADGELRLVEPDFYSEAYAGMEGLRTVTTSPKFWVEPERGPCSCGKCGSSALTRRFQPTEALRG